MSWHVKPSSNWVFLCLSNGLKIVLQYKASTGTIQNSLTIDQQELFN